MDASRLESRASPWVTGALVASAVLLLVVDALLSWLSMARNPVDAADSLGYWSQQSARFLGAVVATAAFVGVAIAGVRAAGGARTLAAKAKVACWTLVGLLVLNCSMISRYTQSPATGISRTDVTDAERQGLRVTADSVTHASFGFSFPIAGANLVRSPELERQMMAQADGHRDIVAWAFRDTVQHQALIVQVTKFTRLSESGFRAFAAGMRKPLSEFTLVDSSFAWRDSLGELGLDVVQPTGLHILVRCLGRVGRSGVICVETMAADASALEASRVGLELVGHQ